MFKVGTTVFLQIMEEANGTKPEEDISAINKTVLKLLKQK
jgi:hypothetical protein